jgi:uncharacterized protein
MCAGKFVAWDAKNRVRACFVLDCKAARKTRYGSPEALISNPEGDTHMATSKRGFASMDAAKQREIASKGGRAAHAKGTAHEFTSDEARVAGRKGGEAVSRDRAHMAAIGREGGHSRGARARAAATGTAAAVGAAAGAVAGIAGAAIAAAASHNRNTDTQTDYSQGTGSQPFVRQANEERSGFESGRNSGGFTSTERRPDNDSNDNSNRDRNNRF